MRRLGGAAGNFSDKVTTSHHRRAVLVWGASQTTARATSDQQPTYHTAERSSLRKLFDALNEIVRCLDDFINRIAAGMRSLANCRIRALSEQGSDPQAAVGYGVWLRKLPVGTIGGMSEVTNDHAAICCLRRER
jgi:hypothetical protein